LIREKTSYRQIDLTDGRMPMRDCCGESPN